MNEIIGMLREKEEELEGEVLGESDTDSLLFPPLFTTLLIEFIFVLICTAFPHNFPLQMTPKREVKQDDL